ncbi:hypothetical protein HanXRQr2_Chr13g0599631 [Helianthus annuus]|uniref:Uncharacterized protein n=1 Tax=Helianthus annuus TaxID=4232 RepID=A0A251SU20_HELAN|nr:hypothetical protein HanXRQr2_Chr13g0599631 [Helianthus annuus]KAJ0482290.1 hypothetical protein HanIR_Chr13g0652241 [Helianthus annuus]KAJ0850190.1 hypothetical protein HanPSC8_Chr13g0577711 [Helianthus annuus]
MVTANIPTSVLTIILLTYSVLQSLLSLMIHTHLHLYPHSLLSLSFTERTLLLKFHVNTIQTSLFFSLIIVF